MMSGGRLHGAARASHRGDRRLPDFGARPRRRDQGGLGHRRDARSPPASRSTSSATATDVGLDIDLRGSGPLSPGDDDGAGASGRSARSRPPHPSRRIGRPARAADAQDRPRQRGSAAGRIPAGDRRRRSGAGASSCARMSAAPNASPICSAASAPSPCGWPSGRASPPPTATRPRWPRSSAPPLQRRGLKPVEALARDLFRRPLAAAELKGYDAVVFDPPRQGAEAQARELAKSAVPVVVAVSCDAATFARDARILVDGGYRLDARHAGRPVPLLVSRRDRGGVLTIAQNATKSALALRQSNHPRGHAETDATVLLYFDHRYDIGEILERRRFDGFDDTSLLAENDARAVTNLALD